MRDVAVVSFAQSPNVRREPGRNEVEMLMPVVHEARRALGHRAGRRSASPARAAATTCRASRSRSSARSTRSARGRRSRESHVEMDGAWALYEAWVKIQTGEVDIGAGLRLRQVVAGRPARGADAAARSRTTWRRSGPTRSRSPRCRRAPTSRRAGTTRARPRRGRGAQPRATRRRTRTRSCRATSSVDEAARRAVPRRRRCATHDCPPITDGAAAVVLAAGDLRATGRASGRRGSAASTTASSRTRSASAISRARASTRARRREGRRRQRAGRRRRAARAVHPRGADPARGARPRRRRDGQPVGRRARREPDDGGRASSASARRATRIIGGEARARASRTRPRARACNRTSSASWRASRWPSAAPSSASARRKHDAQARSTCRWPASCARPRCARSTTRASTWHDIDAVVIGKAPDMFEGVMMPELYLADALGAVGQADAARAHRGQRRRLDRDRRGEPRRRRASTSACSPSPTRSSRESNAMWALSVHDAVPAARSSRAPAATSRR